MMALPLKARPGFIEAVEGGMTAKHIARRFEVDLSTVYKTAYEIDLHITKSPVPRGPRYGALATFDYKSAVALRERGWTYRRIGDELGISIERVRQILHAEGRADLCYQPRIERGNCEACGSSLNGKRHNNGRRRFCNHACQKAHTARKTSRRVR